MSKKRTATGKPDMLGGDTPEMKEKEPYTPSDTAGKEKDPESAGKYKDSTPTSATGKDKDAASSPGEEPGKFPIGAQPSKKKKQASSPHEDDAPPAPATSSPLGSGGTVNTSSHQSNLTQLSEDGTELKSKGKDKEGSVSIGSPNDELKPLSKRGRRRGDGDISRTGTKTAKMRTKARQKVVKKTIKLVKREQKKHQRSFSSYIMKILKDVDSTKRITGPAMMIHDSFANDLSDKIIAAATQLVATAKKKQLGSAQIIAAIKLVLPPDMARDAQKCILASVKSYKEQTFKWQEQIQDVNKLKEKVSKGDSTPK